MKKNVLILGGSSDIGIELIKKFLDDKIYNVNLHYNTNSKIIKNLKYKCKLIKADLSNSNEKNILKKFKNDYDIIINLVGFISGKSFELFTTKSLEKNMNDLATGATFKELSKTAQAKARPKKGKK